jgi:ABC-type sugar transport system permease subunit
MRSGASTSTPSSGLPFLPGYFQPVEIRVPKGAVISTSETGQFGDPKLAIWSLIFINVWKSYPFYLVMILGALQSIPEELWEAAKGEDGGGEP